MEVAIRKPLREDLRGILEVYNHYVSHTPVTFEVTPVTVEERGAWFTEHTAGGLHRLLVAADAGGRIQGWASTSTFRPRAAYGTTVEASVYCRPEAVRQGLGTRLYASLFDAIRDERVERIVAGVTLPNAASVALHERFGFREVGVFTRVGWKLGRYWDVAWFERPLVLAPSAGLSQKPGAKPRASGVGSGGPGDRGSERGLRPLEPPSEPVVP